MIRIRISTALVTLSVALALPAGAQSPGSRGEVVVLGAVHLRQRSVDAPPIDVPGIQRLLEGWRPDQVAIEWLHPSIDPASTFNYAPLGNAATLARLWGYRLSGIEATLDSTRVLVRNVAGMPMMTRGLGLLRRELARLLYLRGEETNAAYQWYLARRAGAPDVEAERLVVRLLDGHEGVVWGFAAAAAAGLEEITAFDYQGPDAGTLVWGEMLEALRDTAVRRAQPDLDSIAMRRARAVFDSLRQALESRGDTTLLVLHGGSPGVREYAAVLRGFAAAEAATPMEADGRTVMRWLQSEAYAAQERDIQNRLIGGITFGGFGARRRAGIRARNTHMVDFLLRDAERLRSRKILIVVGAAHKFELEELLRSAGFTIRDSRGMVP